MSKLRLTGGRGGRTAARAFVVGAAAVTIAPLAASTTAAAAGGSSHTVRGVATHRHLARPALSAAAKQAALRSLAQRNLGHSDGFNPSQFPSRGAVNVMVQLSAKPAVRAFVSARGLGHAAALSAARSQRTRVTALAHSVQSHFSLPATSARTLYSVHNVYSGIAIRTAAQRLAAIARIPGVAAVHPLATYHVANSSTVPLVGAPDVWAGGTGKDIGTGVKIGVIDTGLDYTHATFGGTGSARAYDADHAVGDTPTLNVPSGDYPSAKVPGGIDLAGDNYDPSSSNPALATPHTDPNPLDCEGHGSHVAGTAAGYGVAADGSTFDGDYSGLSGLSNAAYRAMFRVGPGVAPGAQLYPIRVFGCSGDTNLVSAAIDWAADPNGDGNFNDHLDVINMSLGQDFGVGDDADSVASNNASLLGITVVASAGNGNDTQAIAGSPANASRVISVAASDDAVAILDQMQENSPTSQTIPGQRNVLFDWKNNPPVTGDVAAVNPDWQPGDDFSAGNADGCAKFSPEQAARVAGKIAWEEWTDDDAVRACASRGRANNAFAAGAIGVIFTNDEDSFPAGINGSEHIPTFQIRKVDADALRPAAEAPAADVLNVTLTNDLRNSYTAIDQSKTDQIASFSSRGWGDSNVVKPDIAAPGVSVFSTAAGTGNEGTSESGTSMAAPHTSGMAALVKAAHPTWFPEQIKAALMNTAAAPVTSADGEREAPDRVGSGRAQVDRAVGTNVLAYAFGNDGGVGLSFGTPEISAPTTMTRWFTVENNSGSEQTYDLGYEAANSGTQPGGVDYSFTQPSVTVPAHATRRVGVEMSVDPSQLTRPIDAARAEFDPALGLPNYYIPEASGWVTFSQGGDEGLRLPLYAAPKPTSQVHAAADSVAFADQGDDAERPQVDFGQLSLAGAGFDTPDYQSLVAGFELGATSPKKPACTTPDADPSTCNLLPSEAAGDIRNVGATSDYQSLVADGDDPADSMSYFAVSTFGPWKSPVGYQEYDVNIDVNGDGQPDGTLLNTWAGDDDVVSMLLDADGNPVDIEPINDVAGTTDSNAFGNDVMVLPVLTSALDSLVAGAPTGQITYSVQALTLYGGVTDETAPASFNTHNPGLSIDFSSSTIDGEDGIAGNAWGDSFSAYPLYFVDDSSTSLEVARDKAQLVADGANQLLLVHMNNANGHTADVLDVRDVPDVAVQLSSSKAQYSQPVTAAVTVSTPSTPQPTGQVQLLINGHAVKTRTLNNGSWTFVLPVLNAGSTYRIRARYLGDAMDAAAVSAFAPLKVVRQLTNTAVKAGDSTPGKGQKDTFTATVTHGAGTRARPVGTVTFFLDGKRWGKPVALVKGVASKSETGFGKGKHAVKAVYNGNANQHPSQGSTSVTVH